MSTKETINAIGVWVLRAILAGGVVACLISGKDEGAAMCAVVLMISFWL